MTPPVEVAVVIPAYNAAAFLPDCLSSVLGQTCSDLRVVVVDDGSTDGTAEIAHGVRDERVRVLSVVNGGPARARNAGVDAAGPTSYVAFLDADDAWDPDKLREQVTWLDAHPDAVGVGCFMRYVSSRGRVLGETGQETDAAAQRAIARGELFPFPTSSLVVRRRVHEAIGGFDEGFRRPGSEDIDYLARVAQRGAVGCVPRVLGSYRVHPGSAMARERRRINAEARFVRARLAARERGVELTWDAFRAAHPPTFGERWQDRVEVLYRTAALWHGEGRPLRAVACGLGALVLAPGYTLRRLRRQWFARS